MSLLATYICDKCGLGLRVPVRLGVNLPTNWRKVVADGKYQDWCPSCVRAMEDEKDS